MSQRQIRARATSLKSGWQGQERCIELQEDCLMEIAEEAVANGHVYCCGTALAKLPQNLS